MEMAYHILTGSMLVIVGLKHRLHAGFQQRLAIVFYPDKEVAVVHDLWW